MIYIDRTITIKRNEAKIKEPIVLYKGDMNIELQFTIENNPFKYKAGMDVTYGQLVIKRPEAAPIFSEPAKLSSSRVLFIVTGDMIDELEEIGDYDFQIQLLNADMTSRGSLPPVEAGIVIREPLCEKAAASRTYVNNTKAVIISGDNADVFDAEGNYNMTNWVNGDIITDSRLNKIEAALYEINDSIPTDMSQLNNDSGYMTTVPSNYVTKVELTAKDYATESYVDEAINNIDMSEANLEGYATKEYVDDAIANIDTSEIDLTGYATTTYVDNKVANDLTGYTTKEYVDTAVENVSNNLTLDDIENLTISGKVTTDSLTTDMVTANEAITAPMIIAGSASEDDSTVAVLIHDQGVGIKPTYSVDYNNNPPITYYCEEENYYATKGYVNDAIANAGGSGGSTGSCAITIMGSLAEPYTLDGTEFAKDAWQSDIGMVMKPVSGCITINYVDVDGKSGTTDILGLGMIIYVASDAMVITVDYMTTKQCFFIVDTEGGTMTLADLYYAHNNPDLESEQAASKSYVDGLVGDIESLLGGI